jgi:Glycosyl hydrolases family 43/F5/8 type C domain
MIHSCSPGCVPSPIFSRSILRTAGFVSLLALLVGLQGFAAPSPALADTTSTIVNFDNSGNQVVRFDTQGNAIDAHDGGISQFGGIYYLYGTSYNCGFVWEQQGNPFCGFKSYSSTDLVHWKDDGFLFDAGTPTWQARCNGSTIGCFRPHVLYNNATQKYVLWINDYSVGVNYRVFESSSPIGPFMEVTVPTLAFSGSAGNGNNGDENLFMDDTGTAYIVYTNWQQGGNVVVEQLNAQFESGTGHYASLGTSSTEAPAMFKRNGLYYVTYSDPNCGYCNGTGTSYKTATSPLGTWKTGSKFTTNSCGGQPTHVATLATPSGTTYLYQSDLWNGSHNEALANYFWASLSFNNDGSIQSLPCSASFQITLSNSQPGQQQPIPGLDQSDGVDGFISFCDIGHNIERLQTFTPSRSDILTRVGVTTFQKDAPNADLHIDIVSINTNRQPTGTLSANTVPVNTVGWSAHSLSVMPNLAVTAGQHYGILLYSATSQGCYGFAYNDANLYSSGQELYSSDSGSSFRVETNRAVKFLTTLNLAGGSQATTSSSHEGDGWGLSAIKDGQFISTSSSMGWSSDNTLGSNHAEWIQLDLGISTPLGEIDLYPRTDAGNVGQGFPLDFTIATSGDGIQWTTVISETGYPLPSTGASQIFSFAAQNARYIRVQGTNLRPVPNDNNAYRMQFAEIALYAPKTNRTSGATPTASSSHEGDGWGLSMVKDGQFTSTSSSMGWSSDNTLGSNHTEWVQLDFGSAINTGEVTLYPRSDGPNAGQGFPLDFTIAASTDCSTWTTLITETSYPITGAPIIGGQSFFFSPQTARCVRVQGTTLRPIPAENNAYRMQFAEIAIF